MRVYERTGTGGIADEMGQMEDQLQEDALLEQSPFAAAPGDIAGVSLALAEKFGPFVDTHIGPIGRVVSSEREPSGAHQFHFWADDSETNLDVGHIVVTFSEEAAVIGVVDEPRRFSDLRSFLDDYFDRQIQESLSHAMPTRRPELLVFTVNVLATRHLRDDVTSQRPPIGGPVFYATSKAIEEALGRRDYDGAPIPALMHINGNPAYGRDGQPQHDEDGNVVFQRSPVALDEHYLIGPEAGHANWTGQSGLATKTSHALFLTSAVFQTLRRKPEPVSVAALMFNVKGPDLLWLDKPATPDPDDPEMVAAYAAVGVRGLSDLDCAAYRSLGLEPEPFTNLRIFAPFKPGQVPQPNYGANGTSGINLDSRWSPATLNTLRNAPGQSEGRVFPVLWTLQKVLAAPHRIFDYNDLDDKLWGFIYDIRERDIQTMAALGALFDQADAYFEENPSATEWQGHHKFTLRKARNRFRGLTSKFGGLLAEGDVAYGNTPEPDASFSDQELRVIDIANCNTNVQELIVSSVINRIWRMAEEEKLGVTKLIIFVDELNKYAPGGGQGGLRDTLVDIAARGRHLNVVLFGAQQFRSKVDDEILGNCGTSLYGRIGDEEMVNAAYRSISETAKAELLGLPKGRLLVRHAHFRAPLFGTFPFPPTIPGMRGQQVFNGQGTHLAAGRGDAGSRAAVAVNQPADGIWNLLRQHMGAKAPQKSEVRAACQHLGQRQVETLIGDLHGKLQSSGGNRAFNPWKWTQTRSANIPKYDDPPF